VKALFAAREKSALNLSRADMAEPDLRAEPDGNYVLLDQIAEANARIEPLRDDINTVVSMRTLSLMSRNLSRNVAMQAAGRSRSPRAAR
jgi:hypothetical protein